MKLKSTQNDFPIATALCVFRTHNSLHFLGYYDGFVEIKLYGKNTTLPIEAVNAFEEIQNDKGGCIFVNEKKVADNTDELIREFKKIYQQKPDNLKIYAELNINQKINLKHSKDYAYDATDWWGGRKDDIHAPQLYNQYRRQLVGTLYK